MINTVNLPPFKKMCMTIGNLPSSFMESLTYYEALCWLYDYFEKTLLPAINTNSKAITELQVAFTTLKDYVDNYFDNLNIQEEVNNKLDEMAEDGTLENIIAQYIQLSTTYTYATLADMKTATNLIDGSFARTSGYYNFNDGGGASYHVRASRNDDVVDDKFIVALADENLVAELLYNKDINVKQIGAYGDNEHDDSSTIQLAINKLAITGGNLIIPKSTYLFNDVLVIPDNNELINIIGNNSGFNVIIENSGTFLTCSSTDNYCRITIKDLSIINNSENDVELNGIYFKKVTERTVIDNLRINGFYDNITFENCWNLTINKLISIYAKNDGFHCTDVTNAFNINSCIFTHNAHFNFLLTGRGHSVNCCDFSIYTSNAQNKFYSCDGLSITGCYYEETNNPLNPFYFQACRGVSINGCYFELNSTTIGYYCIRLNGSRGINIIGCNFRSNTAQDDGAYLIYTEEGSSLLISNNSFRNSNKVCYVYNSNVSVDNNQLESVTSFLTQYNHAYAKITGNMQYTSEYNACTFYHKEVVHLIINNLITFGNTASRPTGIYQGQQYFNTQTNHLDVYTGSTWV